MSFWKSVLIAAIVSATVALIIGNLLAHHGYSCPPGQHLVYMVPSDPGHSPGLQECVR